MFLFSASINESTNAPLPQPCPAKLLIAAAAANRQLLVEHSSALSVLVVSGSNLIYSGIRSCNLSQVKQSFTAQGLRWA
jgi:hypothetical protein